MADSSLFRVYERTNLAGVVIGFWTVIEGDGKEFWKCRCICGNVKRLRHSSLMLMRRMAGGNGCECDLVLYHRAFEKHVVRRDGCWGWNGGRQQFGYGRVHLRRGVKVTAHRISWVLHRGPIPDGLCVLHRCDNPECTNPEHLFLGSNADNTRDAKCKGRLCHGTRVNTCKVNETIVLEIIRDWKPRVFTLKMLSQKYCMSFNQIRNIVKGRHWQHLLKPAAKNSEGEKALVIA